MKVSETIYSIELSEKEISTLVNALQTVYNVIKSDMKERVENGTDDGKEMARLFNSKNEIRMMRNDFAEIIGRKFLGEDA